VSDEGIPATWTRICGLSLDRHTAGAVWLAHDRKAQVISAYGEYSVALPPRPVLAAAINARCRTNPEGNAWIPVIMDGEACGRSKMQGATLMGELAALGVNLNDARYDEEAGYLDVDKALNAGKLFVEPTMARWLAEYRSFGRNRETGKLPAEGFHLMRATGLCLMVEPSEWISENRATSDREGYDAGDRTRNPVTGY
jgi:hypothetical protein